MKLIKFVLPAMLVALTVSAESMDTNCRIYAPKENHGKVVDGEWVPDMKG